MNRQPPPYAPQLPQLKPEQIVKLVIGAAIVIFVLVALFGSFYTVPADSEAVVLRFGKYSETAPPGLHFKLPFGIDKSLIVPVNKNHTMEFGFHTIRAGKKTVYARRTPDEKDTALMLTGDLNMASIEWTLQYTIKNAKDYLVNVENVPETIRDVSESVMRKLVGDRSVDEIITVGRAQLAAEAWVLVQERLDELGCAVSIKAFNLQDVGPPVEVKDAFDSVNRAKQKKKDLILQARREREQLVPAAGGKAKLDIMVAKAYKKKKILEAEGQMKAFLTVYAEYSKAKKETRVRLYLETIEKILARTRNKIIIDESIKGILPHLDLGDGKGGVR